MANFIGAYLRTAAHEGGYQNDSVDTGNYNSRNELVGTNWGINAQVYESWIGYPPSERDMRSMTSATAKSIYKARYWNNINGDQIGSQALAEILYDGHVNHGNTGIRLMQEVLGVQQDGKVGPITLDALNSGDTAYIYNAYKQSRIDFYNYLVVRTPAFQKFLRGWLIRINAYNDFPHSVIVDNGNGNTGTTGTSQPTGNNNNGIIAVTAITALTLYLIFVR